MGIPARDESLLIAKSLDSVLRSADHLSDPGAVRVVVACDSCTDGTVETVEEVVARDSRVEVITGEWRSAGAARAAAIDQALARTAGVYSLTDTWIATTDADTFVPLDWLNIHATSWSDGDHAVAGIVALADEAAHVQAAFRRHYTLRRESHDHVHGANLGVRGDAYLHVGGFLAIGLAEDHALWRALQEAGYTCRSSVALHVATSGRLVGRAAGGFADTLRSVIDAQAAACPADIAGAEIASDAAP